MKFSIVVLTYNRSHLVTRAIESALNQEYPAYEVLVVNDHSTDNTTDILSKYGDKIKVINHTENKGVNGARNTGIENATGNYLIFLDDDDELLLSALNTFRDAFEELPKKLREEVAVIKAHSLNGGSSKTTGRMSHSNTIMYYQDIISNETVSGDFSSCINLALVGKMRFPEKLRGSEDVFWWKLAKYHPFYYVNKPVKRMYYQVTGLSHSMFSNSHSWAEGYSIMLSDHEEILKQKAKNQFARLVYICILYFMLAGKPKRSREYFHRYKNELNPISHPFFTLLFFLSFLPKSMVASLFFLKIRLGLFLKQFRKEHALILEN